jgi:hypothetical protein
VKPENVQRSERGIETGASSQKMPVNVKEATEREAAL